MKRLICILAGLALAAFTSQAALYNYTFSSGFANGGTIPDGNTVGWSDTRQISGVPEGYQIQDLTVSFNISGGFNGDFYGYLSYDNVLVPLVNRVGVGTTTAGSSAAGYSDAGFNVTLTSLGNDIHWYRNVANPNGGQVTGSWQVDGRTIDPLSPAASFESAPRVDFTSFGGKDPNGAWTLFFADLAGGGGFSQVNGWELGINAVPEPAEWGLICAAGMLGIGIARNWIRRRRDQQATKP